MKKIIFIRYSELTLKGKNRSYFAKFLFKNVKNKLEGLDFEAKREYDSITIIPKEENLDQYIDRLSYVIGISWYTIAYEFDSNKEELKNVLLDNIQNTGTFRVSAKNRSSLFEDSDKLTNFVAGVILENTEMKVNLKNFDVDVKVKVNEDKTLVYTKRYQGIEGLPVGSNGRALAFLSGGIDSPVAAFEMMTRGIEVEFLTFLNPITATEEVIKKITLLGQQVSKYSSRGIRHKIIDFSLVQAHIKDNLRYEEYRTTMLRRSFAKYAEWLAKKDHFNLLITGDALGQVASQTVENLTAVSDATELLFARPLIGTDKNTIIKKAKQIGTHDYSILPGEDMCVNFAPKKPVLNADMRKVKMLASEMEDYEKYFEKIEEEMTEVKRYEII